MNKEQDLIKLKNHINDKKKSLALDEITSFLSWSPKFKKENREVVNSWVEMGELAKNNRGRYNTLENLGIVKGTFSVVRNKFAFVDTETEGIFIPRRFFNGALDGDIVLARILENAKGEGKREGEIYKIITRKTSTVVGILSKRSDFGFVIPTHSFGQDIYIAKKFLNRAQDGDLVLVEIDFWGDSTRKPEGKIIERLGDPLDSNVMIEALIRRLDLHADFPKEVLKEARAIQQKINPQELEGRKDLRDLPIITIDGADAKDLDDAVYVEKLENGNYRLIVSIADVSHYIKVGSELDKEAFKRGNSVYLVDRVLPMLPKEISNGICSLNPNEDKLTFTCDMQITKEGKVVSADTYKSVINTAYRMTYDAVNKIFEKDEETLKEYESIKEMCFEMLELSKIIREVKHNRGSIDFDLPEIKVVLDENKKVKYLKRRDRGEAERVIEDFMIAANEAVAEKLFWLEIPSIYRTHEKPDADRIEALNDVLGKFGYRIHSAEGLHPKRFQSIIEDSKNKGISMIVHKMVLMALKQARYTPDNVGHFGLASSYYTHFTSPIRRYSDLMIHRILGSTLKGYPDGKYIGKLEKSLGGICTAISKTERDAMKAEDESVKIKVVEYMLDKIGEVFKGTIIGFSNKKVFIETEELVECMWDITSAPHYYELDESTYTMVDTDSGRVFSLGDKLKVMIIRADMAELEIEVTPHLELEDIM